METHVLLSYDNRPDREQIGPISLIAYPKPIGVTSHFTPLPMWCLVLKMGPIGSK